MAAGEVVPVPGARFEKVLESVSPDLLRKMIKTFAQRLTYADVEVRRNAGTGELGIDPGPGGAAKEPSPDPWRQQRTDRRPSVARDLRTVEHARSHRPCAVRQPATCGDCRTSARGAQNVHVWATNGSIGIGPAAAQNGGYLRAAPRGSMT
jgi:hypothetical protein